MFEVDRCGPLEMMKKVVEAGDLEVTQIRLKTEKCPRRSKTHTYTQPGLTWGARGRWLEAMLGSSTLSL
jgi:hypothetical protein